MRICSGAIKVNIRITQLDGSMPNIALMRLAAWHKHCGDSVYFTRKAYRELHEAKPDLVYGSAIFKFSDRMRCDFQRWAIRRYYQIFPFADYQSRLRKRKTSGDAVLL